MVLTLGSVGIAYARLTDNVDVSVSVNTGCWEREGSPGFWKNWDSHNTYTGSEIVDFLSTVDAGSCWLVPDMNGDTTIDISDMLAIFEAGEGGGAAQEPKFLRQYLATRLNVAAGRLYLTTFHHFGTYDPGDYLGLGGQGTLEQIISAIESKCGTSPTPDQFELMKNICQDLNTLDI